MLKVDFNQTNKSISPIHQQIESNDISEIIISHMYMHDDGILKFADVSVHDTVFITFAYAAHIIWRLILLATIW